MAVLSWWSDLSATWRHPFTAGFLEGLWPFRPRKFEAITGLDRSLQLLVFNEEFLVSASHQLALTTSLPFVHTARRSYLLNDPVKCSDSGDVGGSPSATSREFWLDCTHSFRISPNPGTKSVKENATKQPAFANPETVFVRKQFCNVKSKTTLGNGYLGSRIDEERSEMRYLSLNASCAPSLLAEGTSAWVSQIVVPPSSRGYGTEADLPCVTARGWPKSKLRTSGARSGPKALDDPKSSTRPQVRRDHPLSLSISISGGKETNKDSLSNGERTGKSPA
ncbi:hypothetical protein YC2023_072414 [Brassica napus]